MVLLIPAYEPDEQLVALVGELRSARQDLPIVVVNDGSSPAYDPIFEAVRAQQVTVVAHGRNLGKGRALKTGFAHIAEAYPGADVVCADSDGQHRIHDILRVSDALDGRDDTIVLGARGLADHVPLRSRIGNTATRLVYRLVTGRLVTDTQTGLRAYPASMLPWLRAIEGDRYEYEMSVLLDAADAGYAVEEVAIDTVYTDGNAGSHFRPVADSARVYLPFVRFVFSSFAAFLLDLALLFVLRAAGASLLTAVVVARVVSASANFAVNRLVVFPHGRSAPFARSAIRYFSLAAAVVAANYTVLRVLHEHLGIALLPAKLATEITLFLAGFLVQRYVVFAAPGRAARRLTAPAAPPGRSRTPG